MLEMRYEDKELNIEVLQEKGLDYVQLHDGFVHYEFADLNDGPIVVLVHGLSVSSFIWDFTYEYLRQEGYRVLRYDLYGRGYSARLVKEYYEEIFYSQLYQLLRHLDLHGERLTLIGQSMGGIIVTNYCLRHQDNVEKLVLIDTAGLPDEASPLPQIPQILKVPLLGKRIFKSFGMKRIHDNATASLYNPSRFPDYEERFFEQAQYKGYSHAILSSMLHMPMHSMQPTFEELARLGIPVLVLWGENDYIILPSIGERIKSIIPHAEFHLIEAAGHHPHYEQSSNVNPILKRFIDSS